MACRTAGGWNRPPRNSQRCLLDGAAVLSLIAGAVVPSMLACQNAISAERGAAPNIVLILTDDKY